MNKIFFSVNFEAFIQNIALVSSAFLILSGLFIDFHWLDRVLDDTVNTSLRDPFFTKNLFLITGVALLLVIVFSRQIIRICEKCFLNLRVTSICIYSSIFTYLGLTAYLPFRNHPYSGDEYCYLYQAKIFSMGRMFINIPSIYEPFVEMYTILWDGKLFVKYPPGFPLILSIGVWLKASGLINPFIATLTLIQLYYLVKSFYGSRYGLLCVLLVATTPYFIAYSSSYYSQPAALWLTTLVLVLLRYFELTGRTVYLPLIGFASGFLFLVRPLDALCVSLPAYAYLLHLLHKKKESLKIIYPVLVYGILINLLFYYNYLLAGKFGLTPYPVLETDFRLVMPGAEGFIHNLYLVLHNYIYFGLAYIPRLLYRYLLIPGAVFIPLLAIWGFYCFESRWRWIFLAHFGALVFLYAFHQEYGWPQYGARYYYVGFCSLSVLATGAIKHCISRMESKKTIFCAVSLIFCCHFLFTSAALSEYAFRFKIKTAIINDISEICPDECIVILDKTKYSEKNSRILRTTAFVDLYGEKRNPFMDPSKLIITKGEGHLEQIKRDFPDRSTCTYQYDILKQFE